MKLLFVHGMKIKEDTNGNYYTDGSYSPEIWERYLSITDHLSVIARKEHVVYDTEYARLNFNFFDREKIQLIEVPNLTSSIRNFLDIRKRKKLNEIVKESVLNNDYIICRLPSTTGNIAVKFALEFDKPFLVEVVGCAWDALWNHSLKGKIIALPNYVAMKKSVKKAPYVIYVTNEFLQKRYPATGESTNCSNVALKEFDNKILKRRLLKIENMTKGDKIIIGTTAAVNVRYKGQQDVIAALGKLKMQGISNYEYQLVGGGEQTYLKSVAERYDVSDQVKFLGSMPHDEVFTWLDTLDIYIQPSKTEGLPRALIEAMSRGLPAIGSNAGGIPELLEKDCIFNKFDYKELIEIILKNVPNKEWLKNKSIRNFEKAKEYDKSRIELRRNDFLKDFRKNTVNRKIGDKHASDIK
ncbi:MAG TPA: glycosyltransferase family 4 protein [Tepidanaerobacter syntrophicus]|uniref:glycosyltransferase family 4 protein n=1 Tax=Tepidanaerobacter syntrophicus TaxID=224999 RepID=UPI00176B76B5|nr:glycosyltransferase family 4 protein [Tepidanaerobacter syntrophicus]HHV84019.1 glycosyltransferase family 4 protein [Tepidanaerobacter syntrophicus]